MNEVAINAYLSERQRYSPILIDRIIEVVTGPTRSSMKLPTAPIVLDLQELIGQTEDSKCGTEGLKYRTDRRTALRYCLERAGEKYEISKELKDYETNPSHVIEALGRIEKTAEDLKTIFTEPEFETLRHCLRAEAGSYKSVNRAETAVWNLEQWARQARTAAERRKRPRYKRHVGDEPLNEWIADLCFVYEEIFKRKTATSVAQASGEVTGPFVRFVQEAACPLGVSLTPSKIRGRVRRLQNASDQALKQN